jgi:transcriptional regulator with XRE-family HTH domain
MEISNEISDEMILVEFGARLREARLRRNLSQQELADEAGVGRATVARIESGESAHLESVIRLLRALGLLDVLDQLIPEPAPSPVERLRRQGRERRRATGTRSRRREQPAKARPFRWGDEGKRRE